MEMTDDYIHGIYNIIFCFPAAHIHLWNYSKLPQMYMHSIDNVYVYMYQY